MRRSRLPCRGDRRDPNRPAHAAVDEMRTIGECLLRHIDEDDLLGRVRNMPQPEDAKDTHRRGAVAPLLSRCPRADHVIRFRKLREGRLIELHDGSLIQRRVAVHMPDDIDIPGTDGEEVAGPGEGDRLARRRAARQGNGGGTKQRSDVRRLTLEDVTEPDPGVQLGDSGDCALCQLRVDQPHLVQAGGECQGDLMAEHPVRIGVVGIEQSRPSADQARDDVLIACSPMPGVLGVDEARARETGDLVLHGRGDLADRELVQDLLMSHADNDTTGRGGTSQRRRPGAPAGARLSSCHVRWIPARREVWSTSTPATPVGGVTRGDP